MREFGAEISYVKLLDSPRSPVAFIYNMRYKVILYAKNGKKAGPACLIVNAEAKSLKSYFLIQEVSVSSGSLSSLLRLYCSSSLSSLPV
ncbi:hypothetical protein IJ22_39720 [Paenibacillus naphthalenovorans]|uniref:Uncharacterized protein n=1 Tax=Paenibacillus naphthalenovorans TaxID=162209 RepID=A0A0U2UMG3_9BACL|nr:hypothetical protein IJ22_39720 [Paenibacillus naphthalenovorans]SDI52348.1 hypothetical protein SAMN05421868_107132 [Paenibacillus naphthalenovorans]